MEDQAKKQYILHYIFKPDFTSEDELHNHRQAINEKITTFGGEVGASICQESIRRLAYPIKKIGKGYSCEAAFIMEPEKVNQLAESLRHESKLLRHMIELKKPRRIKSRRKPDFSAEKKKEFVGEHAEQPSAAEEKREKISIEELDKKLEEIIKNI